MLRDVLGEAGLAFYPQVALILFLATFGGICVYVFLKKKSAWDRASRLPLEDNGDMKEDRSNG